MEGGQNIFNKKWRNVQDHLKKIGLLTTSRFLENLAHNATLILRIMGSTDGTGGIS